MKSGTWSALGLVVAGVVLAGSAFAQSEPRLPRRIDPGDPIAPDLGGNSKWMFVQITGQVQGATLGDLVVRPDGNVFVWSIRREALPVAVSESGVEPRRIDPGDPTHPREGGGASPASPASPPGVRDGYPTPRRTESGDLPLEENVPMEPVPQVTISTLYQWDGVVWSPALVLTGETGASVFLAKSGDLYAGSNLPDGTIRIYRQHHGEWLSERLPDGVRGPAGAFAGENIVFMRAGDFVLRHTGNHWKVEFFCNEFHLSGALAYLGRDQIMAPCEGHEHVFDGSSWFENPEALPTHVHSLWGGRDADRALHLFGGGCDPAHFQLRMFEYVETRPGSLAGRFDLEVQEPMIVQNHLPGFVNRVWGLQIHDVYATGVAHGKGHLYGFDGWSWIDITRGDLPTTIGVGGTEWDGLWVSLADGRMLHRLGTGMPPSDPAEASGAPISIAPDVTADREPGGLQVRTEPGPQAILEFSLPDAREVSLSVYDLGGRHVETLRPGRLSAGVHRVTWNANGSPSGIYFCRLEAGTLHATRKVLIQK
jgi:hypothetical protein